MAPGALIQADFNQSIAVANAANEREAGTYGDAEVEADYLKDVAYYTVVH